MRSIFSLIAFLLTSLASFPIFSQEKRIESGLDVFFEKQHHLTLKNKKIGLITNHTGVDKNLKRNIDLFKDHKDLFSLSAIFFPEHGANGASWAEESLGHEKEVSGIPLYSLHGAHRRPTDTMLKNIDVLIYDIQEVGCRSYTYAATLFYAMEEAVKKKISVIVLDRPNPINGLIVDGPMLKNTHRSFLGYVNVPYCHGMTIGELASFFNEEYLIGCDLKVIPMEGWRREMSYADTGLSWIPTSPYIPEPDTPFFYASTGVLGTLNLVNIGIGYTLPFKVIGAPWIRAESLARTLNEQKLPGVYFIPFHYKPFYGKYKGEECQGVKIEILSKKEYRPVSVQYLILGVLKNLYPEKVDQALSSLSKISEKSFCQVSGNDEMIKIIREEKYIAWKLIRFDEKERLAFLEKRKKHLLY
jgi:uncharacterized protein YbbC (DUF1343 family)